MSGNGRGVISLGDGSHKREIVLSLLRQGHTRGESAEIAGVHRATLWRQLRRDPEFLDDVVSAEQEALDPKFGLLNEWISLSKLWSCKESLSLVPLKVETK